MSKNSPQILKLIGKVQHYPWGGTEFIPSLLSVSNPDQKPYAEYWMGAHPLAPSEIVSQEGKLVKLGNFLDKFLPNPLPYLLKVLDVKDMLSIQVHPSKETAEEGFEKESKQSIPLNAQNRNYKDKNHKPELVVALSDFWLLHGFKPEKKMITILSSVPELNFLLPIFKLSNYRALYEYVMEMEEDEVNERLEPLLERIVPLYQQKKLHKEEENFWAARAAMIFNHPGKIDRGIFSIYLLNLVRISAGEGIFQSAGVPHAYLEGQNVEIMSNSDNVLRGGLTTKHVDVPELLKNVKFQAAMPMIIHTEEKLNGEEVYITPSKDFQLSSFHLSKGEKTQISTKMVDIIFVLRGKAHIGSFYDDLNLGKGEAAVLLAADPGVLAIEETVLFRATIPSPDS